MDQHQRSFDEDIRFFLNACPGPAVVKHGLHLVAFQKVPGIPPPAAGRDENEGQGVADHGAKNDGEDGGCREYLRTVSRVAGLVGCRQQYLSEAARRHGYHYSRALRWIRFLHGMALRERGVGRLTVALSLGFSDVAGWSRFTRRLVGRTPSQLPSLPLHWWVRRAIDDLFMGSAGGGRGVSREQNH